MRLSRSDLTGEDISKTLRWGGLIEGVPRRVLIAGDKLRSLNWRDIIAQTAPKKLNSGDLIDEAAPKRNN